MSNAKPTCDQKHSPCEKGYITTYALSYGIIEADMRPITAGGNIHTAENLRCLSGRKLREGALDHWYHKGRAWFPTLEEAQAKADKMRTIRLESLRKQIAKLQELKF